MKKAPLVTKARPRKRSQANGSELDTRQLLAALMAFKRGDFSARLPDDWTGSCMRLEKQAESHSGHR